jgi:hypothetical protein
VHANFPTGDSEHGHTSCEFRIGSVICTGITEISYGDNQDWGEVEDNRGFTLAHVRGPYKADDTEVTIIRSHWDAYEDTLPLGWRLLALPIAVQRRTPGLVSYTDRIIGCRWQKMGTGSQVGVEAHLMKLSFKTRGVCWKDKDPFVGFRR